MKYSSATIANGLIYCPPSCARRALVFDPARGSCRLIGTETFGILKYGSAVTGADGGVYCLPSFARQVIRIDPATDAVEPFGPDGITGVFYGVLVPEDGYIYDRGSIQQWIRQKTAAGQPVLSPSTGVPLKHTNLIAVKGDLRIQCKNWADAEAQE